MYLIKAGNKKCVHVVALNNWQPELCAITIPNLLMYAKKIKADFNLIDQIKFPTFPPNYERFQIWEEGKDYEWNFNIDADTILHPDCEDPTVRLSPVEVASLYGLDTNYYFDTRTDPYFMRYNYPWGMADQFTVSSIITHDVWTPTDMTFEEASKKCLKEPRQVSEYILSRNMARFGLKHAGALIDQSKHFTLMFTSTKYTTQEGVSILKNKLKEWGISE